MVLVLGFGLLVGFGAWRLEYRVWSLIGGGYDIDLVGLGVQFMLGFIALWVLFCCL